MLLISALLLLTHTSIYTFLCPYTCNTNPLQQIYPNQNMCLLLAEIPTELKNLPYVMYPNCDVYNTNRFSYNKRFNYFPHAIIVPTNISELQYAFGIITSKRLPFTIRAGGHSAEPASLSSGYIIDLRNFNNIVPDIASGTVSIGAGCKLGDVISALGAINYAIPTGECVSVGVTGLTLGGGLGFLARKFGLTADSVISMTVLTADNTIIEVSKTSHPDLFWALAGAGANSFGIVLNFVFKMHFLPTVSFVRLRWRWDPIKMVAIAKTWQQWFPAQSRDITSELVFAFDNGVLELRMSALKSNVGFFNEWQETFLKFHPTVTEFTGSYLGASELFVSSYTQPFSKAKSKFTFKPLSDNALNCLVNFFTRLPENPGPFLFFIEMDGCGSGAIQDFDSSYFPRNAFAAIFEFAYWPHQQQTVELLNLARRAYDTILEPFTSPFSYSNLVDYDLGPNYLCAYYGTHVSRLIKIKNIYDPTNIFHWRQSIPLQLVPVSSAADAIKNKYCVDLP